MALYDQPLLEDDAEPDPLAQFARWFEAARAAGVREPEAMTLATATPDGMPSARMVLLKGFGDEGFVFYTNLDSRKGRELRANPRAALCLYWDPLGRQVRIEGEVTPLPRKRSEAYFATRPRGSRLGAWASRQSAAIHGRRMLEERLAEVSARFAAQDVPLPPFWGGFRLRPTAIEFWQNREDRLHDRLLYRPDGAGGWAIERLSP